MTDLSTPGEVDASIDNTSAGHAIAKAGTGAWIVDGADIAGVYSSLDETALNAFNYNTTDSGGRDAVIDPGEAYVGGWLCRDTQTTVTLPANTTTTVYAGYDASAALASGEAPADSTNVIVGPDGNFAPEDPRTAIWAFDTDSSSITGSTDLRQLRKPIEFDPVASEVDIDTDLNVSGGITLDNGAAFNSGIDIVTTAAHVDLFEADNDNKEWRFEAQNGDFQVTEVGVATQLRIDSGQGGRVEHPNGGAFGDLTTFNANVDMAEHNIENAQRVNFSTDVNDFMKLDDTSGGSADPFTLRFDGRDFRLWAGTGDGEVFIMQENGGAKFPNGDLETRRGWMIGSDTPRSIYVGSSFPSGAESGDFLFEPQ